MQPTKESTKIQRVFDRRDVAIILGAALFVINFLLVYFVWLYAFPEQTGIMRIILCWIGAYAITWVMTYLTKGFARLVLTLVMLGVQYTVFHYRP